MSPHKTKQQTARATLPRKRLVIGGIIIIIGHVLAPLSAPIIAASGLATGIKAPISGFLLLGFPQLTTIVAVIILGKPGFAWVKMKLFGLLKKMAPPARVSRARYITGLSLFILVLIINTLEPYVSAVFPELIKHRLVFAMSGDIILMVSVFILGGDFWDKLQALFTYKPLNKLSIGAEKGKL